MPRVGARVLVDPMHGSLSLYFVRVTDARGAALAALPPAPAPIPVATARDRGR